MSIFTGFLVFFFVILAASSVASYTDNWNGIMTAFYIAVVAGIIGAIVTFLNIKEL